MNLLTVLESAVDKAFLALKDLVKEGILEQESNNSFNFSTGTYEDNSITKKVSVIITETKADGSPEPKTEVLVKTKDIGFTRYTRITVSGIVYRIEEIKQYEGITMLLVRG